MAPLRLAAVGGDLVTEATTEIGREQMLGAQVVRREYFLRSLAKAWNHHGAFWMIFRKRFLITTLLPIIIGDGAEDGAPRGGLSS
jgi:hypothetical protein